MKNYLIALIVLISLSQNAYSQSYMDPAQSYKLLKIENDGSTYTQIGNYKVIGTPYLFGGKNKADVYAKGEFGSDVVMSYNTYSQQIEFGGDGKSGLVKDLAEVDSFILKADGDYYMIDLFFINAALTGSKEKCFFQVASEGPKYSLYKKYSSKLDIVTANYVQSELRQFTLGVDFFYFDKLNNEVNKLKLNKKAIIAEFKTVKDLTNQLKDINLSVDTENTLRTIFSILNQ